MGSEVAKIPGQKPKHDDISRDSRKQIMSEIKKAWASDKCTETDKRKK
jgi:hypothetical protein